ncbi:GGDEF domain-containing protein [Kineococcus aurantiacus]|uniref:GGDEF domain-containing protein n=1 Tax=Kineococcus aurantiacus TaxID=37633 RepID=A0A7Y9DMU6_9ACTN|nr:GGDEF domain-containing protein [Kineococcus aurantiacus]NYD23490.1 GGDEF domain-containing protein [Kineococcus aurantiacus]
MSLVQLAARSAVPSPQTAVLRTVARPPAAQGVTDTSLRRSARQVVEALAVTSGLDTWYLGRLDGAAMLPLAVSDEATGVLVGRRIPWSDTVCRRMANGLGPAVAPDITLVPNYVRAPSAIALRMTAYAGAALRDDSGRLLGAMAGWSSRPGTVPVPGLEALMGAFAELLTQALAAEVAADDAQREAERLAVRRDATDKVTALSSRVGWGALLQQEDRRTAERGLPVALLVVDIGRVRSSTRLQKATETVVRALPGATVSRLTARQFGAILPDVEPDEVEATAHEVTTTLRAAGFEATGAWAASGEAQDLSAVWTLAEQRLYRARRDGDGS